MVSYIEERIGGAIVLEVHLDRTLTKPSSGIRPNVSCFGLRLKVPRGAGRPLEVRQLISGSFVRFYTTQMITEM